MNRNIILLFFSKVSFITSVLICFTVAGLVGVALAPTPLLATLPSAMIGFGSLVCVYPASLAMQRFGRRSCLMAGALCGVGSGILALLAIASHSFGMFCAACALMGIYQGISQYLRFAASEVADPALSHWVISAMIFAGVIGAFLSPLVSEALLKHWPALDHHSVFYGSILFAAFGFLSASLLSVPARNSLEKTNRFSGLEWKALCQNVQFRFAILHIFVANFLLILFLVGAPLFLRDRGADMTTIHQSVRWQVLGMFLPSFLSASLIRTIGHRRLCTLGLLGLATAALAFRIGVSSWMFLVTLFGIGMSWNFIFVSASDLVVQCISSREKAYGQGISEWTFFASNTLGAYSAGVCRLWWGWEKTSGMVLVFLAVAALCSAALQKKA